MAIGLHIDDSVYGPLYFDYGGDGKPHDRKVVSYQVEGSILRFAPDIVLVQVTADADVIAQRMKAEPHPHSPLRQEDIPTVLDAYDDAFERSTFRHKIALDTSSSTVEETVAEFEAKIEPHLTEADRSRILVHRSW